MRKNLLNSDQGERDLLFIKSFIGKCLKCYYIQLQGSAAAAEKFTTLDEFKSAKTVKVNPDKPQENVRFHTLEVSMKY